MSDEQDNINETDIDISIKQTKKPSQGFGYTNLDDIIDQSHIDKINSIESDFWRGSKKKK